MPIMCADALAARRTFGKSGYPFVAPFSERTPDYHEGLCPVAERDLKQLGTLRIFENWTERDIDDIAAAFRKVAGGLNRRA